MSHRPKAVLVGPPGAGKTTVGRRLASALGTEFTDTDALIAQDHGTSCGEVFAEVGEEAFRELEYAAVEKALAKGGIVALGGGAVETEAVRTLLAGHRVVWVDVSAEEGARRTSGDDSRPILAADDPKARYTALLARRAPLYRSVAAHKVRTDNKRPPQIVADVLNWLDEEKSADRQERRPVIHHPETD
ncbi:shikimate kinase [Corynebacterium mendelii]|uniref:Shikimate kinase n=1 Tax=Corynebacterium mendelii TaxID=2765362 RepID=A0A939DY62_9CORY|nr:shikimate kinase [Corynebacterium mendelii]MBN9643404.1 shikimate kinase [Corynebacterium mendelii]